MAATAAKLEARSLDTPHETRNFVDNGHIDAVTLGGVTVGRGVFDPGWQWSKHVKPIAATGFSLSPGLKRATR